MSGALCRLAVCSVHQGEGRHLDHTLARGTQWLAARGQQADARGFLQDDIGQYGDRVEEVLAVVEDENCLAAGQVRHKDRGRPLSRLVHEPHAVAHGPLQVSGGA